MIALIVVALLVLNVNRKTHDAEDYEGFPLEFSE